MNDRNLDFTNVVPAYKPRVYVASAFGNREEVRHAQKQLIEIGYVISHDWTNESSAGKTGQELEDYLDRCGSSDVMGVYDADLVFLAHHTEARGACTELGLAVAWGKPIIVAYFHRHSNIFFHLKKWPHPVPTKTTKFDSKYRKIHLFMNMDGALAQAELMMKSLAT